MAEHQLTTLCLPPRYFSWRLRGGPLSLIYGHGETMAQPYDLLIATSMVDISTLRGLVPSLAAIPAVLYFHENQFFYPANTERSTAAQSVVDRQMVQIYSSLAADALVFNSHFNQRTFVQGVSDLVAKFPDQVDRNLAGGFEAKSWVLPIPVACPSSRRKVALGDPVRIVWNHRVEYDKGIEDFYGFLGELNEQGEDFRLILLGQRFRKTPEAWQRLTQEFAAKIEWDGYVEAKEEYLAMLSRGDLVVSTAQQEFQGLAFLEAIGQGCLPLAPNRLVYPEYLRPEYLYGPDRGEMVAAYRRILDLTSAAGQVPLQEVALRALDRHASRRRWQLLLAAIGNR